MNSRLFDCGRNLEKAPEHLDSMSDSRSSSSELMDPRTTKMQFKIVKLKQRLQRGFYILAGSAGPAFGRGDLKNTEAGRLVPLVFFTAAWVPKSMDS